MVNQHETALERQLRLKKEKQRRELKKLQESPASRAARLEKRRQRRRDESPTTRASRLQRQRQKNVERRRAESPTSYTSLLEKRRQRRRDESPTSRATRREKQRLRNEERRRNESPTSRASRLEKERLRGRERLRNESPTSRASRLERERERLEKRRLYHEARLLQKRQVDEPRGNAEVSKTNIDQDVEMNSIQKEEDNIVNVILDNIDGDKNCNDVRRDNIDEMSNDFCNNDASGIKTEYATILSDEEGLFGEKSLLSYRVSNNAKASTANRISNVELNSAIENLSDSNLGIPNKNALNLDLHPSEPLGKYQCFRCPLNFTEKNYLSKHLMRHFDHRRPFMCQVCEKTFPHMCHLITHISACADIKHFQCQQCGESFTSSSQLSKHRKKAHSGISPYKCAECDYVTFRKHDLKRHTSSHMDDRPFKCNNCSYASKSQQNLKAHERTHKDDKSYKCDICYSRFVHPKSVRPHRKKHFRNGLTIHRCRFCPSVLDSLDALRKHIEVVHRDEILK